MFCVIAKMVFGFGPNGMSKLKQMETYITKMERNKLKKKKNNATTILGDVKRY